MRCPHPPDACGEEEVFAVGNRAITYLVCYECGATLAIVSERRVTEF